jgi:hypothetical protein
MKKERAIEPMIISQEGSVRGVVEKVKVGVKERV